MTILKKTIIKEIQKVLVKELYKAEIVGKIKEIQVISRILMIKT